MKKLGLILLVLLGILLQPKDLFAHNRRYVFNQEYRTIPQGQFELENWLKFKVPDRHVTNENNFEYQEELEYGITDRWTLAHYESWETQNQKGPDDATVYKGFKFEAKYRIGEKGKYWVDPLVYLEWTTNVREEIKNELEGKIVLSKDFGKLNVNFNQIMESELSKEGRTAHEYTFGANYELPGDIHIGVEGKGDWWRAGSNRNRISLGPTMAWEGQYFWVAAGVVFGLNHAADDVEARVAVGIPLPFETPSIFGKDSSGKGEAL